jgi:hypothetical protein
LEIWLFLKDSLNGEIAAFHDLLLLSEQEKEAIIQNDVQSISSIVEKQQSLLNALKTIKSERERRLSAHGKDDQPQQLKELVDSVQGALGDELRRLFAQRESAAEKLRTATALNRKLIDTQLQYTSYCINLITGQGSVPGTYSVSGTIKEEGVQPSIIDQTI